MRVAALIPAFDEADRIVQTVAAAYALPGVVAVVVVDDCSRDDTASRARETGALTESLLSRTGKGGALEAACKLLESTMPMSSLDAVLLLDADLGPCASEAAKLLVPLQTGVADLAVASFPPPPRKAGLGLVKRLAHNAIAELGGLETAAPLSGQRALTVPCLSAVRPFAPGFGMEVAMSIQALQAGYRLVEVATTMSHRASGRTIKGFLHRGRQYLDVRRTVRRLRSGTS